VTPPSPSGPFPSGRPPSVAEFFHEETKYSKETIGLLAPADFDLQPVPFKDFHCTHPIDLVPFLPFSEFPLKPESGQEPVPLDSLSEVVGALSRMLYFTNGATGISQGPDGVHIFRSAPSAGALYPTEIYLALRGIRGVTDGLYNYSVRLHQLALVFEGDFIDEIEGACWDHPSFEGTRVVALLTGVYGRSTWRYHDRAYRRILLDTGHVLGNLCHAAREEGFLAVPLADFNDQTLTRLFFLDPEAEGTLVVAPIVSESLLEPGKSLAGAVRRSPLTSAPPSAALPLYLACHQGGGIEEEEPAVAAVKPPDRLPGGGADGPFPLAETLDGLGGEFRSTLIRRRSTRRFTGGSLDLSDISRVLDFGHRALSPGRARFLQSGSLLSTYLVCHRVDGLKPGAYRYLSGEHQLAPVVEGDLRVCSLDYCLGQDLAGDAAALVVHCADLATAVEVFGDRAYRYLHLDAGFIGQQMNLAATHLGVGVSGIAGFFDDEVNDALRLPATEAIIYITVLGRPFS